MSPNELLKRLHEGNVDDFIRATFGKYCKYFGSTMGTVLDAHGNSVEAMCTAGNTKGHLCLSLDRPYKGCLGDTLVIVLNHLGYAIRGQYNPMCPYVTVDMYGDEWYHVDTVRCIDEQEEN